MGLLYVQTEIEVFIKQQSFTWFISLQKHKDLIFISHSSWLFAMFYLYILSPKLYFWLRSHNSSILVSVSAHSQIVWSVQKILCHISYDNVLLVFKNEVKHNLSCLRLYHVHVTFCEFLINISTQHSIWCQCLFASICNAPSYEAHYNSLHRHSCQKCQRSFPSTHLLEIHVLENHDTLFSMIATRKNLVGIQLFDILYRYMLCNYSNWTEWTTIQGEITRVISKSDEGEAQGQFQITSMISLWIVRHDAHLLINQIYNKFRNSKCLLKSSFEWTHLYRFS